MFRWQAERAGRPPSRVIMDFPYSRLPARPKEGIGNVFAKIEFQCLPAAAIGRSEFEQDGRREVVVKRCSQRSPR